MTEPQVNYVWDSYFPPQPTSGFRKYSGSFTFSYGVLAGKNHTFKMRGWFDPCYELCVPTYPNARVCIPEAKVQLIFGGGITREFPLTFPPSSGPGHEGEEILHGWISRRFTDSLQSLPLPQGIYTVRLLFTLKLEKSIPDVVVLGNDVTEKSNIPDFLFRAAADVKIVCGVEEFLAHKSLLAEKSPVFRKMFENEMTEALTGQVVLDKKEIAPNSVLQLLHFLYSGKMKESKDVYKDLFVAGEKCDMKELKGHCENYLARTLVPEDAAEFYELAEIHHGELLKAKALGLLKLHKTKLFSNAAAFRDFTIKYPELMLQLFKN